MAINEIGLIDLCKKPKIKKKYNLGAPLSGLSLDSISSMGCKPLVSHQRHPSSGLIFDRFDQNNGNFVRNLLTTADDLHTTQYLTRSVLIAGAPANQLTGTIALPYPIPDPAVTYLIKFFIGSDLAFFRQQPNTGLFQTLGSFPLGYGVHTEPYPVIILGGGLEYDGILTGSLRPYHTYRIQCLTALNTLNEPMLLKYDESVPEYVWPPSDFHNSDGNQVVWSGEVAGTGGNYFTHLYMWECRPCLLRAVGDVITAPILPSDSNSERNGPSLHRQYCYVPFDTITMPGFGESEPEHDYTINNPRSTLVIYVDGNTDAITINGVSGTASGASAPTGRFPFFAPPNNMFTPSNAFIFDIPTSTDTFVINLISGMGQSFINVPLVSDNQFTPSGRNRYYEAICKTHFVSS